MEALLFVIAAAFAHDLAAAERTPQDWLTAMRAAVQSSSYEGTVVRTQDDVTEALKVVRTVMDGVVNEKVVAQEGSGLEIIRSGNEVRRVLPDRQSVLIQQWDDRSTLFSMLPDGSIKFGNEYDLSLDRTERIAGREALVLSIRPHDHFRYAHRIWLDTKTAFPLQTQLIDAGTVLAQLKFADIRFDANIEPEALASSYSTEQFTWFKQSSAPHGTDISTPWISEELPAGFVPVSTHEEKISGSEDTVTHILFSDGLANVSVFISTEVGGSAPGASSMGGSNSYCARVDDFEITAIGEVPAATVKQIATSMQLR